MINRTSQNTIIDTKLRTDAMVYTKLVAVSIVFFIIVILPSIIQLPFEIPNRIPLSIVMLLEFSSGYLYEILIQIKIKRNQNYQILTYLSAITDITLMAFFLHFVSGISGDLFFFYTLNIMGAAYTFRRFFPYIASICGVFFILYENIFILQNNTSLSLLLVLKPLLQIIYLIFMGYYGSALSQKIIEEKRKTSEIETANKELQKAQQRINELIQMKAEFTPTAMQEIKIPIHAINNYLWILKQRDSGKNNKKREKMIEDISNKCESLLLSIKSLDKEKANLQS